MVSDYVKSLVRTCVPVLVAAVVTGLAHAGIPLPAGSRTVLASLIGGVVGAAWYAAVRVAERRWRKLGWLLGTPGAPSYPSETQRLVHTFAELASGTAPVKKAAPKPVKTTRAKKTAPKKQP